MSLRITGLASVALVTLAAACAAPASEVAGATESAETVSLSPAAACAQAGGTLGASGPDCSKIGPSNYRISGPIFQQWTRSGGLAVNGYPLEMETDRESTPDATGRRFMVTSQQFERTVIENHLAAGDPNRGFQFGLAGHDWLDQLGRLYRTAPGTGPGTACFDDTRRAADLLFQQRAVATSDHDRNVFIPKRDGFAYDDVTHHNVLAEFDAYIGQNGGVARFGRPITEPISMSAPSTDRDQLVRMLRTVRSDVPSIARDLDPDKLLSGQSRIGTIQFFERGRLELHGSPTGGSQVMGGRNVAEAKEIATAGPDRCQMGGPNRPRPQ